MGVFSSPIVFPRSGSVRVYVETDIEIRDTANHAYTIAYTTHMNPLRMVVRVSNNSTAHDQELEVMLRVSGSHQNKEIFDLAGAINTTADSLFIFSPTVGSASGQTVTNYTVPLLDNWIPGDNLYVIFKAAVAPTTGSINFVVGAHY